MWDYIPTEVVNDIFTRLPVKTLLICTSVCKLWYSLITSPIFISTHLNRTIHNNHTQILIRYFTGGHNKDQYSVYIDNESFDKLATLEFPLEGPFTVIGNSKGLMCLADGNYWERIILWNPSIKKYVTLPMPSFTYKSNGHIQQTIGFGFNALSNDYKVVRVVYLTSFDDGYQVLLGPKVDIYELTTGRWRNIDAVDFNYIINPYDPQVFLNGVVHWIGNGEGLDSWIVTFNLENEAFGAIKMPHKLRKVVNLRVAVYKDSLSLINFKGPGADRKCCIWVKDDGVAKSWRKQFKISPSEGFYFWSRPFGFRANGDALIAKQRQLYGIADVVSYDLKSRTMKNLGLCGRSYAFSADTFMESLVLVRHVSACDAGGGGEGTIKDESQEHIAE